MQLFKSLLLTLLIVGTLNSCKKDDGGGDTDKTDNSDTTQPNYTVAAVNIPGEPFSYILTKESNYMEGWVGEMNSESGAGEITYDTKGNPSEFYIVNGVHFEFNTEDNLITEIIDPEYPGNEIESNFKLISKNNNSYTYGHERDWGDDGVGISSGCIIKLFPKFDSLVLISFTQINDKIEYEDSFGLHYRKACKTSFSINALNFFTGPSKLISRYFPEIFCMAKILDNMGATYFTRGVEDDDGNHKDYKVTFNDNNLPVRVDGLVTRRIWTATYQ